MKQTVHFLYKFKTRSPFCVGQLLLIMGPTLECFWYTQWYSIGINWFSFCQQVSIANNFLVSGDPMPISYLQILEPWLTQTCNLTCGAATGSMCSSVLSAWFKESKRTLQWSLGFVRYSIQFSPYRNLEIKSSHRNFINS